MFCFIAHVIQKWIKCNKWDEDELNAINGMENKLNAFTGMENELNAINGMKNESNVMNGMKMN